MVWLTYLQWPAMLVTIAAAWLTASGSRRKRKWGFWAFLVSNVLWIVWAIDARVWAVIILQVVLAVTNIRGARKNETA